MICTDCGKKKAFAKGLCSTCYARQRRKFGKKKCRMDGCERPAVTKGMCARCYKRSLVKIEPVADLPGERWEKIPGHPKMVISTMGRVKSLRNVHEKLITPQIKDGRLVVIDWKVRKNFSVHIKVLEIFRPGEVGDPIFKDGNRLNPALENLEVDTRERRIERAIALAEQSTSPFASAFIAYWRGDRKALDNFFADIFGYLYSAVSGKLATWGNWYKIDIADVVHAALLDFFWTVYNGRIKHFDNLKALILDMADHVISRHWKYTRFLTPLNFQSDGSGEDEITKIDDFGYAHPSAELVAMYQEAQCSTN